MGYLGFNVMERYTVPQIVWIDRKFNIRSQTAPMGEDQTMYKEDYWRSMIETLLKDSAGGATPHHTTAAKAAPVAAK